MMKPDPGTEIANILGMQALEVGPEDWRRQKMPELLFVAGNASGEEVRLAGAEQHLEGTVLLTGMFGDSLWTPTTETARPLMRRPDHQGLSLTEYRLWKGFIHCPVPFWGARHADEINSISSLPEMKPWTVKGYNRPICRRIVETHGVPREMFGQSKMGGSVAIHNRDDFLTEESLDDFVEWFGEKVGGHARGKAIMRRDRTLLRLRNVLISRLERIPFAWRLVPDQLSLTPTKFRRLIFPWALERASERYARPAQT